jgi:NAD(P)-dependent dehydrogenase (short-subunit alcohol dehydrogenase family)
MSGHPDPSVQLDLVDPDRLDLAGRRIVAIGGTDGLGRAIARLAAERGAEVTVVGRTFRDPDVPRISFVRADLSSMAEARRLGATLPADPDVVLLTNGILAPGTRQTTAEGLEVDTAVSYLSRVAVLDALLPRLRAPRPRVFVMGFPGAGNLGDPSDLNAERTYRQMDVHMNTVAGNEALVLELARHPGIGAFGLNPGLVKTNIRANVFGEGTLTQRVAETLIGLFTPTPERYARTVLPILFAPELEARTGLHFNQKGKPILPTDGLDDARVSAFGASARALIGARAAA